MAQKADMNRRHIDILREWDDEQKQRVRAYFNGDKGWQGEIYQKAEDWFARTMVRRKRYTVGLIRQLGLPAGSNVLDVGFGSGVYLEELARMDYCCTGIDASAAMIGAARERLRRNRVSGVNLLHGDIEHLPFSDSRFNLVLTIGVLGYLPNEQRAVKEIRRVLAPGGVWIVNVVNGLSLSNADFYLRSKVESAFKADSRNVEAHQEGLSYRSTWVEENSPVHHSYRLFHPHRFEAKMSRNGFRVETAMTFGFPLRLLRRIPFASERVIDRLEDMLERSILRSRIKVFRYAGESYTVLLRKIE